MRLALYKLKELHFIPSLIFCCLENQTAVFKESASLMTQLIKQMCGHKDDVYPGASWRLLRLKSASSKASGTRCSFSREVLAMVPEALTLAQQLSSSGALSKQNDGKASEKCSRYRGKSKRSAGDSGVQFAFYSSRGTASTAYGHLHSGQVAKRPVEYMVSHFSLPCWALLGMGLLWLIKHLQSGFPSW